MLQITSFALAHLGAIAQLIAFALALGTAAHYFAEFLGKRGFPRAAHFCGIVATVLLNGAKLAPQVVAFITGRPFEVSGATPAASAQTSAPMARQ